MKKKNKKKIDISAKEACFYFNNVLLNSKHCLLIPAMEPGSYNVANWNTSSSCINLPLNSEKQRASAATTWPRTVKRLQRCVLRREEIIRGTNLLAEVINRKLSIHIHKAPTNLREWHQFPKGQPARLPPPAYLLLNTKETWIYQVRTVETLMKDGFHSASQPHASSPDRCKAFTVQSHVYVRLLCGRRVALLKLF